MTNDKTTAEGQLPLFDDCKKEPADPDILPCDECGHRLCWKCNWRHDWRHVV